MPGKEIPLEEQIVKGQPLKLTQTLELQFQEGALQQLQEQNAAIQKSFPLTESAGSPGSKRKLRVTVEGIHTGMTKNLTFYPGDALESSVPTWTTPHPKPVLKNHSSYTEPLGRIVSSEYVKSILTDGYTVRKTLELTDQDAIDKVLDKRYLTLSVGGSANRVNCSICMKNLVEEGWCGHRRGQKYEGKTAHWVIGEYTGDEISFVNMPADVYSQVIAAEVVQEEGGNKVKKESNTPTAATEAKLSESEADMLDSVLGLEEGQEAEEQNSEETPSASAQEEQAQEATEPNATTQESNETPSEENEPKKLTEEELQEQIEDLRKQVELANAENLTLSAELSEAQLSAKDLEKKLEESEETIQALTEEKNTFVEQNVKLAKFARKMMAERVADLRILQGKSKSEERDALISEWSQSSAKVLESTIQDLLKNSHREIPSVQNPGLVTEDKNEIRIGDNGQEVPVSEKKSEKEKALTLADMAETMVKTTVRGYH